MITSAQTTTSYAAAGATSKKSALSILALLERRSIARVSRPRASSSLRAPRLAPLLLVFAALACWRRLEVGAAALRSSSLRSTASFLRHAGVFYSAAALRVHRADFEARERAPARAQRAPPPQRPEDPAGPARRPRRAAPRWTFKKASRRVFRRRVAATPRPRRGHFADGSRRRRGHGRVAAKPRPRTGRGDAAAAT